MVLFLSSREHFFSFLYLIQWAGFLFSFSYPERFLVPFLSSREEPISLVAGAEVSDGVLFPDAALPPPLGAADHA